jgi:hypothetical protein
MILELSSFLGLCLLIAKMAILARFGAIWEPILGAILGPNRPKRSQDEPKRSIKSPKIAKTYNCKNLKKTIGFSRFLGFQGLPKQLLKAQGGSQEAILSYSGTS